MGPLSAIRVRRCAMTCGVATATSVSFRAEIWLLLCFVIGGTLAVDRRICAQVFPAASERS